MTDQPPLIDVGDPFREPVSSAQLAECYGVDIRSLQNWDEKGWIRRKERGVYILGEAIRGVYDAQAALINKKKGPDLPDGQESADTADRRKKIAEANLKELEEAEKRQDLLSRIDVEKQIFNNARRVRDAFENLPSRLSSILAAETDAFKVKILLDKEFNQIMEELCK